MSNLFSFIKRNMKSPEQEEEKKEEYPSGAPVEITVDDLPAMDAATKEIFRTLYEKKTLNVHEAARICFEKKFTLDLVKEVFPGAAPSQEILVRVTKVIESFGLNDENTLFASSICPDEINHEEGDIPNIFADHLGEVFHMGGLGGLPFTGKTGFGAFSHHVPDSGHALVLMAPHIGLSEDNQFGKYTRDGQSHTGAACGAAVGALNHCCSGKHMPDLGAVFEDYQMCYIIQEVNKRKEYINAKPSENERQAELAHQMHDIGTAMLNKIVNLEYGDDSSTLVILTGIQINMPRPFEDYFQPLTFELRNKKGETFDLYEETFGMTAPR